MISEKEWKRWMELIHGFENHHGIRRLTEKDIIKSMLKNTTNAENLVTGYIDGDY